MKVEEGKLEHIRDNNIEPGKLRFDGVYFHKSPGSYYYEYIRLYEDDYSISMAGVAEPDVIAKNFHRNKPNEHGGKYHFDSDENIRFIHKGLSNVEYVGQVGENCLYLTAFSHVTDHHSVERFDFKPE